LETMLEPDEADRFPSADRALQALISPRYRRAKHSAKNAFPWRGAIASLLLSACGLSIFHQYRYTFLTMVGLQPSDLCQSITRGENQLLDDYLRYGGNANVSVVIDGPGYQAESGSLLHCAVAAKQLGITKKLLQRGADLKAQDNEGKSVLHRLVRDLPPRGTFLTPSEKELLDVLAKRPELLEAVDNNNETPLFWAVRRRKIAAVRQLLARGANVQAKSVSGANMIHGLAWDDRFIRNNSSVVMASGVDQEILQLLLDRQVDINGTNNQGEQPIHTAIQSYNNPMLQLLIERGANLHGRNNIKEGRTPLMVAIEKANSTAVSLLLEKGARVDDRDSEGLTASILLIQNNNWQVMNQLLDRTTVARSLFAKKANPNLADQAGRSPLHWLVLTEINKHQSSEWENQCARGSRKIQPLMNLWLQQGAKQTAVDNEGDTALHLAAAKTTLFKQLLAAGWDPLLPNKQGDSPLKLLATNHNLSEAVTEQLLRNGRDINAVDRDGNTILHRMLSHYQFSMDKSQVEKTISLLVELGANLDIKNKAGQSPLDLARVMSNKKSKGSTTYDVRAYLNQCKIEVNRPRQDAK
jgi:uncharacterized protein